MNVPEFVRESNRIENILRDPTEAEIKCLDDFISLPELKVQAVQEFVSINQPGAVIRDRPGMDVRVGAYFPPRGNSRMAMAVADLLERINRQVIKPHAAHVEYESLHPFTDGNGRSGRAIWVWQMWTHGYDLRLGFLHTYYYQTLEACRVDEPGGRT